MSEFLFEDIVTLEKRAVIRVLQEVDSRDLCMAFKSASDKVKSVIFACCSERVATGIQEEMDCLG